MKNVMVCVTQQKTCDRLIKFGYDFLGKEKGELFIIHVAHENFNFLGNSKEGDALEYLYQEALTYGANLTVVRSQNVLETLLDQLGRNKITHVILGESKEGGNGFIDSLKEKTKGLVQIIVIPHEPF